MLEQSKNQEKVDRKKKGNQISGLFYSYLIPCQAARYRNDIAAVLNWQNEP